MQSASGLVSAAAIGVPVVISGADLVLFGVSTAEEIGSPSLVVGATTVFPNGVPSAEATGAPIVVPPPITVIINGVASAEALGLLHLVLTIVLDGVASAEAIGLSSLHSRVQSDLAAIQSRPALVRSFFHAPSVAYTRD